MLPKPRKLTDTARKDEKREIGLSAMMMLMVDMSVKCFEGKKR